MMRPILLMLGLALIAAAVLFAVRSENLPQITETSAGAQPGVRDWACPSGTVGRISCKFVSVPEDYDDPEIARIDLFVAQIDPPRPESRPPIVFIGDELGGVTVADFGEWHQLARTTGRQIVLIDQRGSGRSEPRLACEELSISPWLEAQLGGPGLDIARNELNTAVRACRTTLANTVTLEAYSLDAMATDIETVRQRLGIDEWSVGAAGEATLIARRSETLFPDSVESLLLLGATDSSADRHIAHYNYAREVLDEVLGSNLSSLLDDAVVPLSSRSIVFAVVANGRTRRVSVSAEVVHPTLARVAGDDQIRETFPALITDRMAAGQWRSLAVLRNQQYRATNAWAAGVALSVLCGDPSMASAEPLWLAVEDFDTSWVGLTDDPTLDPDLCRAWNGPDHVGVSGAPSGPTLVVNGEYDVTAPRSAADEISSLWPDAAVITLPESGRPSPFDPCVMNTIEAFLGSSVLRIEEACT